MNSNTYFRKIWKLSEFKRSYEETFDDCSRSRSFSHVVAYFEVSRVKQIPWNLVSLKNKSIDQLKEYIVFVEHDMLSINTKTPEMGMR